MRTDARAPIMTDLLNARQLRDLHAYYFAEGGALEADCDYEWPEEELSLLAQCEGVRLSPPVQRSLRSLFALVDRDGSGSMEEAEFRVLNRAMYTALQCFWDPSLAELSEQQFRDMASDDWAMDCPAGLGRMDGALFGLSLFQLAHTWTRGGRREHEASQAACLDFLSQLRQFLCTEESDGEGGVRQRMATDDEIRAKASAKKDKMLAMLALIRSALDPNTLQWKMTDELAEVLISPAREEAVVLYGEGNISTVCGEASVGAKRGRNKKGRSRRLSANSGTAAKAQKNDLDRRKESFMKLPVHRTTEMVLTFMEHHLAQLEGEWRAIAEAVRQGGRRAGGGRESSRVHTRRSSESAVRGLASLPALDAITPTSATQLGRRHSFAYGDAGSCRSASLGQLVGQPPALPAVGTATPADSSKPGRRRSSKNGQISSTSPPSEQPKQTRTPEAWPEGGRQGRRAGGGQQHSRPHARRSSVSVSRMTRMVNGLASLPAVDAVTPVKVAQSGRQQLTRRPHSSPNARSRSLPTVKHPPVANRKDSPAVQRQLFYLAVNAVGVQSDR
jgi:hypothetical protein